MKSRLLSFLSINLPCVRVVVVVARGVVVRCVVVIVEVVVVIIGVVVVSTDSNIINSKNGMYKIWKVY